jgi:hypothetical protein
MKRSFSAALAAASLALLAAACSSSSSPSASSTTHSASASATSVSGTETITGKVTGAAAVSNNAPTYHLTFRGPINTTGTFTPPNTNDTHQTATFHTAAGMLVVSATVTGQNAQPTVTANCRFTQVIHAAYTIEGAKSTGQWAGSAGTGNVVDTFSAYAPKLSNGHCNLSQNVQPLAKGAFSTFNGTGTLTRKA